MSDSKNAFSSPTAVAIKRLGRRSPSRSRIRGDTSDCNSEGSSVAPSHYSRTSRRSASFIHTQEDADLFETISASTSVKISRKKNEPPGSVHSDALDAGSQMLDVVEGALNLIRSLSPTSGGSTARSLPASYTPGLPETLRVKQDLDLRNNDNSFHVLASLLVEFFQRRVRRRRLTLLPEDRRTIERLLPDSARLPFIDAVRFRLASTPVAPRTPLHFLTLQCQELSFDLDGDDNPIIAASSMTSEPVSLAVLKVLGSDDSSRTDSLDGSESGDGGIAAVEILSSSSSADGSDDEGNATDDDDAEKDGDDGEEDVPGRDDAEVGETDKVVSRLIDPDPQQVENVVAKSSEGGSGRESDGSYVLDMDQSEKPSDGSVDKASDGGSYVSDMDHSEPEADQKIARELSEASVKQDPPATNWKGVSRTRKSDLGELPNSPSVGSQKDPKAGLADKLDSERRGEIPSSSNPVSDRRNLALKTNISNATESLKADSFTSPYPIEMNDDGLMQEKPKSNSMPCHEGLLKNCAEAGSKGQFFDIPAQALPKSTVLQSEDDSHQLAADNISSDNQCVLQDPLAITTHPLESQKPSMYKHLNKTKGVIDAFTRKDGRAHESPLRQAPRRETPTMQVAEDSPFAAQSIMKQNDNFAEKSNQLIFTSQSTVEWFSSLFSSSISIEPHGSARVEREPPGYCNLENYNSRYAEPQSANEFTGVVAINPFDSVHVIPDSHSRGSQGYTKHSLLPLEIENARVGWTAMMPAPSNAVAIDSDVRKYHHTTALHRISETPDSSAAEHASSKSDNVARRQLLIELREASNLMEQSQNKETANFWRDHVLDLQSRLKALDEGTKSISSGTAASYSVPSQKPGEILEKNRRLISEFQQRERNCTPALSTSVSLDSSVRVGETCEKALTPIRQSDYEIPMVDVIAPADLPGGYHFEAEIDGQRFLATVPAGGVRQGEAFTCYMRELDSVAIDIPVGYWKDDFSETCSHGCCHCVVVNSMFCPLITLGQIQFRTKLDFLGRPRYGTDGVTNRFMMVTIIGFWAFTNIFLFAACNLKWSRGLELTMADISAFALINLAMIGFIIFVTQSTRSSLREKFMIREERCFDLEDLCCATWCLPCTVCQMARHTANYDDYEAVCCSKTGLPDGVRVNELNTKDTDFYLV